MSIRVGKFTNALDEEYISIMNADCEKSYVLHDPHNIEGMKRDFQRRVDDERTR